MSGNREKKKLKKKGRNASEGKKKINKLDNFQVVYATKEGKIVVQKVKSRSFTKFDK